MEELGRKDLPKWAIVLSGYSSRHLYRMAQNLVKALKDVEIPEILNPPKMYGRKDDEWILVECKDIMVHMFTEEAREDIDLEYKWKNPVSDEQAKEYEERMYSLKKKWKREGGQELKRKW
jgi:ribosomal silencing factor RsfS